MKLLIFSVFIWLFCIFSPVFACEPEDAFCFGQCAGLRLLKIDSTGKFKAKELDSAEVLSCIALWTNQAFQKDKKAREKAQKFIKEKYKGDKPPLILAYWGALRVMKERDRSKAGKLWKAAVGTHPEEEVRRAFDSVTVALSKEPDNQVIRFIHLNIALEAAATINGYLDAALQDLQYLEVMIDRSDSVRMFFLELFWVKYYYWSWQRYSLGLQLENAEDHIFLASAYACTEFYEKEIHRWFVRVKLEMWGY